MKKPTQEEVNDLKGFLFECWWNKMRKTGKVWLVDFGCKQAFLAGMDQALAEKARADTRRMDWLSKPGNRVMRLGPFYRCYSYGRRCTMTLFKTQRAAIDGALFEKPKRKKP